MTCPITRPAAGLVAAGLFLAAGLGVAACTDSTDDAAGDVITVPDGDHDHAHDAIDITDDGWTPTLELTVTPDAHSGVNLQVRTGDFSFAPERASTEHVDGEGRAHVYVDGEKRGRIYTEWSHLDLAPGEHEIRVELSANDHRPFVISGRRVERTTTVVVADGDDSAPPSGGFEGAGPGPDLDLTIRPDARSGWNGQLEVAGFRFAPPLAADPNGRAGEGPGQGPGEGPGEGHGRLFVDGEEVGRLYGEWFHHAADLGPGAHTFRVLLVATDGSPYLVGGRPVEARATVTVPSPSSDTATGRDPEADTEAEPGDRVIEVSVVGDRIEGGGRHDVSVGDTVVVRVRSDVDEELHLHGYDVVADVVAGEVAELRVEADLPGVWELELHDSHRRLLELAVS